MLIGARTQAMHKVIANTDCVLEMATHYPTKVRQSSYCKSAYAVNSHRQHTGRGKANKMLAKQCTSKFQFNHYALKSRSDFLSKFERMRLSLTSKARTLNHTQFVESYGETFLKDGLPGLEKAVAVDFATLQDQGAHRAAKRLQIVWERFTQDFVSRNRESDHDTAIFRFADQLQRDIAAHPVPDGLG